MRDVKKHLENDYEQLEMDIQTTIKNFQTIINTNT